MILMFIGPSSSGKDFFYRKATKKYNLKEITLYTTRPKRNGEIDGREYYFKTVDEFKSLIDYNGLIEWAQYVDNYYGTPRKFVEDEIADGKNVILEIEVQGAMNIKSQYPNAILIFITTKDIETLHARLTGRGSETEEVIQKRIMRAAEEAESMESYEYIVVNDDLDECVDAVHSIVVSETCKKENNTQFLIDIKKELEAYTNK